jgi:hypothetical protein
VSLTTLDSPATWSPHWFCANPVISPEVEAKEDEFVAQTEEAVGVMKNVLDTPEPLRNLAELIAAQLEFHKKAYEILSELAPEIDQLQVEQEVSRHESFNKI